MLPMSYCCSCISDYVHCTEVIFPFNTRSLSSEQAQCSPQQCMSLGWGLFPAGAPSSITCCSGQCPAARELCLGSAGHRQANLWAPAAGHSSNTSLVCADLSHLAILLHLLCKWEKQRLKTFPPPSGIAANTLSYKPLCNGHCCADLTGPVGWVSSCQASHWISRKPRAEAGTFNAGLWPDVIRCRAADQDHEYLATTLCCAGQEQKPLRRRSCCCQDET